MKLFKIGPAILPRRHFGFHKILFLICYYLFLTSLSAQWEWQNPIPQGNNYNDIFFVSQWHGWMVGEFGTIICTNDEGATWEIQESGLQDNLDAVFFTDDLNGWTGGQYGCLLHTEDGGEHWYINLNINAPIRSIWFRNANEGWVGCYSKLIHTTDGGTNWITVDGDFQNLMLDGVVFTTDKKGWIIGADEMENEGKLFYTNNDGEDFPLYMELDFQPTSISFPDSIHGWISGEDDTLLYTGSGGIIWNSRVIDSASWISQVRFINALEGWISGSEVMKTVDGGLSWDIQQIPDDVGVRPLFILDSLHGWGASDARILRTSDGGDVWEYASKGFYNTEFYDIYFLDEYKGWVTSYGKLLATTDGGANWYSIENMPDTLLALITFSDEVNGWITSQHGILLHSPDGGMTWLKRKLPTNDLLRNIFFINSQTGWIITELYGEIFRTDDGGIIWNLVSDMGTLYLTGIYFTNLLDGWIVGYDGFVYHTSDGGNNWEDKSLSPYRDLYDIYFTDEQNGFIACNNGFLYQTHNGGETWDLEQHQAGNDLYSLFFTDLLTGWAAGENGYVIRTKDGGNTWEISEQMSTNVYYSIFFIDQMNGWIAGNKTILHTDVGGFVFEDEKNRNPSSFEFNLYPNPCLKETRIIYTLPANQHVNIKLYNISGKFLEELVNESQAAGTHQHNLKLSNYPPGIYCIEMETNRMRIAKKVVLINV